MAGDWIPMVHGLADSVEVVRIAAATRAKAKQKHTPNAYETVGALHRVWCIADAQTDDGRLEGYTPEYLDAQVGIPGFAKAMADVGWLIIEPQALVIPHFSEHLGRSAKRRMRESKRQIGRTLNYSPTQNPRNSYASEAENPRIGSGESPHAPRTTEQNRTEQIQAEENNSNNAGLAGHRSVVVVPLLQDLGYDDKAVFALSQDPHCTPEQIAVAVAIHDSNVGRGIPTERLPFIRTAIEGNWTLPVEAAAKSRQDALLGRQRQRVADGLSNSDRRIADDLLFEEQRAVDREAFDKLTPEQQQHGLKRHLETMSPKQRTACAELQPSAFAGEIVRLMAGGGFLEEAT